MKKVLFLGLIFGAVAFTSCSKTYTCEIGGSSTEYDSKDYTDLQLDLLESSCEGVGGTWSAN